MAMRIAAAAALGALLIAAPAGARPAGPAAAQPSPTVAAVQAWAAQAAAWVAAQQKTFVAEERALIAVNAGAARALEFHARGQAREGAAWALDWAAARRLELAGLRARAHEAGTAAPPLPEALADLPDLKAQDAALRELSRRQSDIIRVGLGLGEEVVGLAQKAASGDGQAAARLPARRDDLSQTILRSENLLVEASNSTLGEGDPQADLGRAAVSGNLAVMALIEARKRAAAGDAAGAAASVRELREQAGRMLEAARQAPPHAAARAAALEAQPDLAGTPFAARVKAVLATFSDSAQVESGIAEALLTVAGRLEKGEDPSSAGVQGALAGLNPLLQRRVELDLQRKSLLAGRPS